LTVRIALNSFGEKMPVGEENPKKYEYRTAKAAWEAYDTQKGNEDWFIEQCPMMEKGMDEIYQFTDSLRKL